MSQWVRVAACSEVTQGSGKEVLVGEQIIAVYNVAGEFFAMHGNCPHAGGPLAEGSMNGSTVTCPWHGWQFDVKSGRNCLNARISNRTFGVKVEGNDLFVEVD